MTFRLVKFHSMAYVNQCLVLFVGTPMNQNPNPRHPSQAEFTDRRDRYLAFIQSPTKLNRRPPAVAEMQVHFRVSSLIQHRMILNPDHDRLIERIPGQPRNIRMLVNPEPLPTKE